MITITDKEFMELSAYIKNNYGINFKKEKKDLLIGRLQNVLKQNGFNNFTEYYDYVCMDSTGQAATTLVNKVTTNYTFFMREADHFSYFKNTVLPYFKKISKDKDLRIWSAGCSTGEEPYNLAMIIDQFFGKEKVFWDTRILATDISENALNNAKVGVYDVEKVTTLPSQWKLSYFKRSNKDEYIVSDSLKNDVIFRKFNLMDEVFPFVRKFHVIFCRNVMIYFDMKTKYELVNKFYNLLEYGGYLFIGHSESLNDEQARFKYVSPSIYRKA